jgi:hypothetical protein
MENKHDTIFYEWSITWIFIGDIRIKRVIIHNALTPSPI